MKKFMKILLPIALVMGALAVVAILFVTRPQAERHPVEIKEPLVTVTTVNEQSLKIPVFTRGTVTPGTEIPLVSEVSGPVTYVSENFARGGFFKKGEVLIKVDPVEYEVTLKKADAAVAQALQLVKQAEAEKRVRNAIKSNTSELGRFEYQYQQAKAQYDATRAELDAVNLQKRKTVLVAPFDGRVRIGSVNPGQYLRPGVQLGLIYAVNAAEVRLPLSDNQLALVNVPFRFGTDGSEGPTVTLVGDYGGRKFFWSGQVVRAESGVDEFNRLLYVIAQIPDPYAIDVAQPDRPPLTAGNFVEAQIDGRFFEGVYVVPRQALRNGAQVWTVTEDNRLHRKKIEILYKGKDVVYVRNGLTNGDNVVLTQLDIAVEGMKVRSHNTPLEFNEENINPNNLLNDGIKTSGAMKEASSQTEPPKPQKDTAANIQENLKKKLEIAKKTWDEASPTQKLAAVNQAKQTLSQVAAQIKKPAAAQNTQAQSTPAAPAQAASPLADLINQTEAQMKAADTPIPAAAASPVSNITTGTQANAGAQVKGYITIPVDVPKPLTEAAQ